MKNILPITIFCMTFPLCANAYSDQGKLYYPAEKTVEVNVGQLSRLAGTPANDLSNPTNYYITPTNPAFEVASRPAAPRFESDPQSYYSPPPPAYRQPEHRAALPAEPEQSNAGILGGELSGNVGLSTDYTFRGISQTSEEAAIQGGIEFNHDSGAYIGLWASNVNFGDGDQASSEFDAYAGYNTEVAQGLSADGGVIYYAYPGANSALNYDFFEFYAGLEYAWNAYGYDATSGVTLNFAPENFGDSGNGWYLAASSAVPVGYGITVDGHVGHQWIEDEVAFGVSDYLDWSLGAAYDLEGFELKVQYIDTNIDSDECTDICDARAVASVSKSL